MTFVASYLRTFSMYHTETRTGLIIVLEATVHQLMVTLMIFADH